MAETRPESPGTERTREAESVLRRLGYARVAPERRAPVEPAPSFWVQEPGHARRTAPVFVAASEPSALAERVDRWLNVGSAAARRRAIFVAPSDSAAEELWANLATHQGADVGGRVSILVVPRNDPSGPGGHFHLRRANPSEVLRVATGVVVGLFCRAQAFEQGSQIDFEEMLLALRHQFGIDVARSLGVESDEDALYMLYQLAQRDSYAPGDGGANLHLLVLKPTGPAARLPWFAA
jgi:hypothetical protein